MVAIKAICKSFVPGNVPATLLKRVRLQGLGTNWDWKVIVSAAQIIHLTETVVSYFKIIGR